MTPCGGLGKCTLLTMLLQRNYWLPIPMKQKHTVPEAEEELTRAGRGAQSACFSGTAALRPSKIQGAKALPSRALPSVQLEAAREERGWRKFQVTRMSCVQMTDDSNTRAYDTYVAPQLQCSLWSHVFKVSCLVSFMGSGNNWGFLSFCPSLCFPWAYPFHRVSIP